MQVTGLETQAAFFRLSFVSGVTEHGTCPLPTADSRIVCNERRWKCSENIYYEFVLVSYWNDIVPRQTVRRILNGVYWGEQCELVIFSK